MKELVSIDFFVVPTLTFRILYVFLILSHDRRQVLHFNVTEHPSAQWTAQQMIEAFPWDSAPRFALRDQDTIYGSAFRKRVQSMGIEQILSAPRSPWQSPYVERFIGSIRRECLDHAVVINGHLKKNLRAYFDYYHASRTHLALGKDCPESRPVESAESGNIVALPQVGGLHHRYIRRAT